MARFVESKWESEFSSMALKLDEIHELLRKDARAKLREL